MFQRKGMHEAKTTSTILESNNIRDLLTHCKPNSDVIFDLDNVVMESTQELGSDQWFVKLLNHACQVIIDKEEAVELVLSIYHSVQQHAEMKAVELEISRIIQTLQDIKKTPVFALTARGCPIMDSTIRQLAAIDIDFAKQHDKESFEFAIDDISPKVIYKNGIIFCNGNDKGKCLAAFFDRIKHSPEHIVMIDDKRKHLESVSSIFKCDFVGLRYNYLDEKAANIDMKKAEVQLTALQPRLSTQAQSAIKKISASALIKNSLLAAPAKTSDEKEMKTISKVAYR